MVTDYDNESVSLEWTAPDFDGGSPIEKYIIEKKDRYKPDWEKAMEMPAGGKLAAKVMGLKDRGEYQFRVIAVNKAGPSPPSDASKMQMVKHKARECYEKLNLFEKFQTIFQMSRFFGLETLVKPRIDRTNLKPIIVRAGKPIKYDIDVRGEPPPEITWYRANELVKSGGNINIENVDYNTKLSIADSVRKNTGVWKIKAVNASGEDEAEVEVTVLCKCSNVKKESSG